MKRASISPGVYVDDQGRFWARPAIRGRYTWRLLKAVKRQAAIKEFANADYSAPTGRFREVAALYVLAGCPDRKLKPRGPNFVTAEPRRVTMLQTFFGTLPAASIRLDDLLRYERFRVRQVRYGTGGRTVDKDLCTLSNVLNYAVARRLIDFNYIRAGRPRFQENVRHAVQVAPPDACTIHRLADLLLESVRSEVLGWQLLFAMFTGCRTSELLRLRADAEHPGTAGFVQWGATDGRLSLHRSKSGVNPFAIIGPDFAQMLECWRRWHTTRHPHSPWYFPGPYDETQPIDNGALGHALTRLTKQLALPHITPHGLRSFYVTKRRSDGLADTVIAGEIGDKTVSLMQSTYGGRPDNWTGGTALSWLPAETLPAWQRWQSLQNKIVRL